MGNSFGPLKPMLDAYVEGLVLYACMHVRTSYIKITPSFLKHISLNIQQLHSHDFVKHVYIYIAYINTCTTNIFCRCKRVDW